MLLLYDVRPAQYHDHRIFVASNFIVFFHFIINRCSYCYPLLLLSGEAGVSSSLILPLLSQLDKSLGLTIIKSVSPSSSSSSFSLLPLPRQCRRHHGPGMLFTAVYKAAARKCPLITAAAAAAVRCSRRCAAARSGL